MCKISAINSDIFIFFQWFLAYFSATNVDKLIKQTQLFLEHTVTQLSKISLKFMKISWISRAPKFYPYRLFSNAAIGVKFRNLNTKIVPIDAQWPKVYVSNFRLSF